MSQHCQLKCLLKGWEHFSLINYASSAGDLCISHRSTINNLKESPFSSATKMTTKQFYLHEVPFLSCTVLLHNIALCCFRDWGIQRFEVLTRPIQDTFSTYQRIFLFFTFLYTASLSLSFSSTHRLDCYKCCLWSCYDSCEGQRMQPQHISSMSEYVMTL